MVSAIEEKENIDAVIKHIEKETCIEFRDLTADDEDDHPATTGGSDEKLVTQALFTYDSESYTENISGNNIETTPDSVVENDIESPTKVVSTDVNTNDENETKKDEPDDSENKIESDNNNQIQEVNDNENEHGVIIDNMKRPVTPGKIYGIIVENKDVNEEALRSNKEVSTKGSYQVKIPQRKTANVTIKLNEKLKKKPISKFFVAITIVL